MEIEYIYHNKDEEQDIEQQIRRIKQENTIGCLFSTLILLAVLFVALLLLPFFITIIGYTIIVLSIYLGYKMYLERHVLNFIQKHNLRR